MSAAPVWKFLAAGAIFVGLGTAAMAADMGPIESRQACMKANGAAMGAMVPVIKGEQPYDHAKIQEALAATEAACAGWAGWWGEDTKPGGAVQTWAKEEIWSGSDFEAASAEYGKAFGALKASTDEASFKAAFPALGASCQSCHTKFRAPKG